MRKDVYKPGDVFHSSLQSMWTYLDKVDGEYHFAVENVHGECWVLSTKVPPERLVGLGELTPLIGSSDGRIFTEPKKSRKKCLKMRSSMGRNIRNGCYLLEQAWGKDNLSFLTLTLPNLPPDALALCATNWGAMVDQFLKWLRTKIECRALPFEYVYCTEVQTKRLENRGEFALHLHILFGGKSPRSNVWATTPKQCRKAWVRCIKRVYSGTFESSALENLQRVKKSASGYMSKYLSKSSKCDNPEGSERSRGAFNGHWGGMSRGINRSIKRNSVRLSGSLGGRNVAADISGGLRRGDYVGVVAYYKAGFIQLSKGDIPGKEPGLHVGVGCLKKPLNKGGLTDLLSVYYALGED